MVEFLAGLAIAWSLGYYHVQGKEERINDNNIELKKSLVDLNRKSMEQCSLSCGEGRFLKYSSVHGVCECSGATDEGK